VIRLVPVLGLILASAAASAHDGRLLFTGDILLAREVAHEISAKKGASPWEAFKPEFGRADFVFGNLEGAVGDPGNCLAAGELCFAVDPHLLPLLKETGFAAIGIANNHSGDLGADGRKQTRDALRAAGLAPVGFAESPVFLRLGARTVGIVNLNLVPARDGSVDAVPSWQTAQKLRLARALSDWVVVSIHWGKELADWVVPEQQAQAKWLIAQGADVIVGAHPHVVQPPACIDDRPVFYSLGNHVFDQKYPETKHGLIADCRISGDRLSCRGLATETPVNSSFPKPAGVDDTSLAGCTVPAGPPLRAADMVLRPWSADRGMAFSAAMVIEGRSEAAEWRTVPRPLLAAQAGTLAAGKAAMLFTLERHPSSIDDEDGPRPYAYDIGPHGLIARWRGSALAWPLLDAQLIGDGGGQDYLCALHRGDSFIMLDPAHPPAPRTLVYEWNGFGFSGISRDDLNARCREAFAR
jgi:poly-gamma-glutamate synthesis protein (capsule biosynthesis protein)